VWCDGQVDRSGSSCKWAQSENVGSDSEPTISRSPKRTQTDRKDKVQEIVDNLKETHSSHHTSMQLRIWEMISSGMHSSLEVPPNTTMFVRAGGGTPHKRKRPAIPVSNVDRCNNCNCQCFISKARVINYSIWCGNKSSQGDCKPIKALQAVKWTATPRDSGVLTPEEYGLDKQSIMSLLQQLKTNK